MVAGSNAAAPCSLLPSLLSNLLRYVGIAWSRKLARRALGCGNPLQLEINQTEPTGRTQSFERSPSRSEKSSELRRQDPGTSLKGVTVYGVGSFRGQTVELRGNQCAPCWKVSRAWNPAGDAAEGKPLDVGHLHRWPRSSPEFSSGCILGAESSWFETGNVRIWPGQALCPAESPKLQALRCHLNYYLLNVFP